MPPPINKKDHSGSMLDGDKLFLVQQSVQKALASLGDQDRVSIVTFNDFARRLCPLVRVTPQNSASVMDKV